jgi:hypothetical protein
VSRSRDAISPLNAPNQGSGKLKEYEMNAETSELIRNCCSYALEPAYRRGLAWAIARNGLMGMRLSMDPSILDGEILFSDD